MRKYNKVLSFAIVCILFTILTGCNMWEKCDIKASVITFLDAGLDMDYIFLKKYHQHSIFDKYNEYCNKLRVLEKKRDDIERKYQIAKAAQEKGYYKIASDFYYEILEYQDAQTQYDDIMQFLGQFNGTYYGELEEFLGDKTHAYLYIMNGNVGIELENSDGTIIANEMYLYETTSNNNPIMAFASTRKRSFSVNMNAEYVNGSTISKLPNGNYIVSAIEKNKQQYWNGTYIKISDIVNEKKLNEIIIY